MSISDNDVREVLHRATNHLDDRPHLLDDVRRGGRRRVLRRRAVLAAVCAAAVVIPLSGALQIPYGGDETEVASPFFDEPTKGDLAGDDAYLRQVRAEWQRQHERSNEGQMRGGPHVVWAGRTPAGPAAYVTARSTTHPIVSAGDSLIGWAAFVEPTASGPRVKTFEMLTDGDPAGNSQATLLGSERDVLLVLDTGRPVEFSPEMRYTRDGKIIRTYQKVRFENGAAVLPITPQRTKITFALSGTPVSRENAVHIDGIYEVLFPGGSGRPETPQLKHTLPGAAEVWGGEPSTSTYDAGRTGYEVSAGPEALAAFIDAAGTHASGDSPNLSLYGATPDGRRLLVQTLQYDSDPARVIALLARGDAPLQAVASAMVDRNAPLPVQLRLPDSQGILVAAEGAVLTYRSNAGQWQDAGRDAALLPADTTEIRVTVVGGPVSTVRVTA
ncbi:hypothetical protein V6V47_20960 [Micromonospora sp. CPCC 205539]|uniref:hypothetical protein n=1 Tax=Micromonospora sp. CPCC 205539 TaxID=3122408 RepID=UPI002FF35F3F